MKTLFLILLATRAFGFNYPLVNEMGKPFQWQDLKGSYVLVSFIYTRCPLPTMCPLTTSLNRRLLEEWKKKKGAPPLKLVLITLDPERDDPKTLSSYAKRNNLDPKHFVLATGTPSVLESIASEFNVMGFPSGDGNISHNMKSILLDPALKEVKQFADNEWKPKDLLALIK